jgi:hypothetical protein
MHRRPVSCFHALETGLPSTGVSLDTPSRRTCQEAVLLRPTQPVYAALPESLCHCCALSSTRPYSPPFNPVHAASALRRPTTRARSCATAPTSTARCSRSPTASTRWESRQVRPTLSGKAASAAGIAAATRVSQRLAGGGKCGWARAGLRSQGPEQERCGRALPPDADPRLPPPRPQARPPATCPTATASSRACSRCAPLGPSTCTPATRFPPHDPARSRVRRGAAPPPPPYNCPSLPQARKPSRAPSRPAPPLAPFTRLVLQPQDGLSGNSRTAMIATVSGSSDQYHHSINTLKYADRAKEIKTHVVQVCPLRDCGPTPHGRSHGLTKP